MRWWTLLFLACKATPEEIERRTHRQSVAPTACGTWSVREVSWDEPERMSAVLGDGWEPFAATVTHQSRDVLWFRKIEQPCY